MRLLIQRVTQASLNIDNKTHTQIGNGLLVLVGFRNGDDAGLLPKMAAKLMQLRVFPDEAGKMNLSVKDIGGEILLASQFTLWAETSRGNRPSFIQAAKPEEAIPLYEQFIDHCTVQLGKEIKTGIFGADMQIQLTNDGPVTIWIDSDTY
ncbi:MAG: D-tyrosyl-tRNA(Tyr) deacylase [Bacteroidetes bacterium]|nr:D-tyrosyl-tRNA(Tyr) deacylase [Bacteroidota bacterium]